MNEKSKLPELPRDWVWTKLVDVYEYVPTGVAEFEGEIEYYSTGSIKGTVYVPEGIYSFSARPSRANRMVQRGDVLQARMAGTNKALIIRKELDGRLFSTGFIHLRAFSCCVGMSFYVFYYVQSPNFLIQRDALATGSTQVALTDRAARQIIFPLAPLPEQQRIVAKIEELFTQLDAGVATLKKAKAQLRRYRQAVLKAAVEGELTREWREAHQGELEPVSVLVERILEERRARREAEHPRKRYEPPIPPDMEDLPKLPEGWVWASLRQLADKIQYGHTESAEEEPIGPKFLRITDIQDGRVNWDTVPYCKCSEEQYAKYRLVPGDIVFTRTGATTGKSYLISDCPDAVFASYLIRLQISKQLDTKYVALFLTSPIYWSQIMLVKKGSAQPGVNATILAALSVPLPALAEQHRIVAEVEQRFSVADEMEKAVEQSLKRAERLRQSILKRALEGKLVPQDSSDEPASVLLERIRVEKARREGEGKGKRKGSRGKRRKTEEAEQLRML